MENGIVQVAELQSQGMKGGKASNYGSLIRQVPLQAFVPELTDKTKNHTK